MIDPSAAIGAVHLTISDLEASIRFYQSRLGFVVHRRGERGASLGAGGPDLLVLIERAQAPRVRGTTGLYHFAILVPSRADLARALGRLVRTETVMQGAADHGVSEALYLADVNGNGVEIYRDRPRGEWPMSGGRLQMGTDALDLADLLSAADAAGAGHEGLPRETTIGHIHLHVSRIDPAQRFYVDVLGFELMQRYGPSAVFVSAGGYHHHVGLNTWAGVGAPPPPAGGLGLDHFVVTLPSAAARDAVLERVRAARIAVEPRGADALVRDPSGNALLLMAETVGIG
ncbi:MAG TPA: VOC family protein [Vicinamibacterales bacterium]|nr:VOC family protein [Vicinamibacterales bacterium]